jgi:hypothetical protein
LGALASRQYAIINENGETTISPFNPGNGIET